VHDGLEEPPEVSDGVETTKHGVAGSLSTKIPLCLLTRIMALLALHTDQLGSGSGLDCDVNSLRVARHWHGLNLHERHVVRPNHACEADVLKCVHDLPNAT